MARAQSPAEMIFFGILTVVFSGVGLGIVIIDIGYPIKWLIGGYESPMFIIWIICMAITAVVAAFVVWASRQQRSE